MNRVHGGRAETTTFTQHLLAMRPLNSLQITHPRVTPGDPVLPSHPQPLTKAPPDQIPRQYYCIVVKELHFFFLCKNCPKGVFKYLKVAILTLGLQFQKLTIATTFQALHILFNGLPQILHRLHKLLNGLSQTLHRIHKRFDGLSKTLHRLRKRFIGLSQTLHRLHKRFNELSLTLHRLHKLFNGLSQTLHRLHKRFNGLSQTLHRLHKLFNGLSQTLHKLHKRFNELHRLFTSSTDSSQASQTLHRLHTHTRKHFNTGQFLHSENAVVGGTKGSTKSSPKVIVFDQMSNVSGGFIMLPNFGWS